MSKTSRSEFVSGLGTDSSGDSGARSGVRGRCASIIVKVYHDNPLLLPIIRGRMLENFGSLPCQGEGKDGSTHSFRIFAGSDPNKDQTYFLWAIPPAVLPRVLFPVGGMFKSDVRKKARELKLATAEKKESMGICFVGEVNIPAFLKTRIPEDPGEIVTTEGKVVGTHEGVAFYTIGQRHRLNVGGGTPYYVVGKHPEKKQLIVSSQFHPALHKKELTAASCNWFFHFGQDRRRCFSEEVGDESGPMESDAEGLANKVPQGFFCSARVRYRQPLVKCEVTMLNSGRVRVIFDEPQRAVTPGQSIVFYNGESFDSAQDMEMLGGGIIE